jgi:hypothetical protein
MSNPDGSFAIRPDGGELGRAVALMGGFSGYGNCAGWPRRPFTGNPGVAVAPKATSPEQQKIALEGPRVTE